MLRMRRPRALAIAVLVMVYLPLVAVIIVAGVIWGWRVPVVFAVVLGAMLGRGRWPSSPGGRVKSATEFVAFALFGGVIGGLLFGGVGAILGAPLGFVFRLAEVPITGVRRRSGAGNGDG